MLPTPVLSLQSDRSPSLSSQPRPPRRGSRQASQAGECWSAPSLCAGISLLCPPHSCGCALLRGSEASPLCHPQSLPVKGLLVRGNLSSFTAPSHWCRCRPYSFVSVISFFFCPTQVCEEFLAFWEVWGLLPAFSRCSVGVVPHVFLMYLWGGRWSPRPTPPPSSYGPFLCRVCDTIHTNKLCKQSNVRVFFAFCFLTVSKTTQ